MKIITTLICISIATILFGQNTVIKTANGKVQGAFNSDKTIRSFKGIPFAAPPVGELRWKAPQPVKNWQGVKACTTFLASPMQSKPVPFMC